MIRSARTKRPDPVARCPIDGIDVMRQAGMIYWYVWGHHEFDIRVVRRVLGLAETRSDDNPVEGLWTDDMTLDEVAEAFVANAQPRLQIIVDELRTALAGRPFLVVLAKHDAEVAHA